MSRLVRMASFPMVLALLVATLIPGVVAGQSDAAAFRPACQLVDQATASAALGVDVTADDSAPVAYCTYRSADTTVAAVSLTADLSLPLMRMAYPDVTDLTVGGHQALSSAGDADQNTPPLVAVALDDGVLLVQIMADAGLDDPVAAATALAEAIVASGPVSAVVPQVASGSAIEFTGDPCSIVSLGELKDIVGKKFETAEPDGSGEGCTYNTDPMKDPVFVSVGFSDGDLGTLRTGKSEDLTVGDRTALYWPDMSGLFVDAGGGRLFQVIMLASGGTPKASKVQQMTVDIAELAVGRMTPAAAPASSEPVAGLGGDCPLISADALDAATGGSFEVVSGDATDGCVFTSADQVSSVIVGIQEIGSLDDAWAQARQSFEGLPDPTTTEVGGHPAYAGAGTIGSIVVVDLAGTPDGDGKVLGVLVIAPTTSGDQVAVATSIAEEVVGGL